MPHTAHLGELAIAAYPQEVPDEITRYASRPLLDHAGFLTWATGAKPGYHVLSMQFAFGPYVREKRERSHRRQPQQPHRAIPFVVSPQDIGEADIVFSVGPVLYPENAAELMNGELPWPIL